MLNRLKNILGIEGVKIEIDAPASLHLGLESLDFTLFFYTKSDQLIESVTIRLIEKYKRGWRNSKLIDEYILYENVEELDVSISPEEKFSAPLTISFDYTKSPVEKMGENILLKPLSKIALMAKRAKSNFRLEVSAQIKGVRVNPLVVHYFEKAVV